MPKNPTSTACARSPAAQEFVRSYLDTALDTEHYEVGGNVVGTLRDHGFNVRDIAYDAREALESEATKFYCKHARKIESVRIPRENNPRDLSNADMAGYLTWLISHGHGHGFEDTFGGEVGYDLDRAAEKEISSSDLSADSSGKISAGMRAPARKPVAKKSRKKPVAKHYTVKSSYKTCALETWCVREDGHSGSHSPSTQASPTFYPGSRY